MSFDSKSSMKEWWRNRTIKLWILHQFKCKSMCVLALNLWLNFKTIETFSIKNTSNQHKICSFQYCYRKRDLACLLSDLHNNQITIFNFFLLFFHPKIVYYKIPTPATIQWLFYWSDNTSTIILIQLIFCGSTEKLKHIVSYHFMCHSSSLKTRFQWKQHNINRIEIIIIELQLKCRTFIGWLKRTTKIQITLTFAAFVHDFIAYMYVISSIYEQQHKRTFITIKFD